jgi:glycosyltransferase involved in cell wall biosynthesis
MGIRGVARRVVGWLAPPGSRRRGALAWLRGWRARRLARPLSSPFDLAALNRFLGPLGLAFPSSPNGPITADNSARRLLELLAARPELHQRFPQALRQGSAGAFATWLRDEAGEFTSEERAHLLAALEQRPGNKVLHWYDHEPTLPAAFPLALTPEGSGALVAWLIRHRPGVEVGVGVDEALWFLFEQAEDPAYGLAATYRRQPDWQKSVPHGLGREGWDELRQWVRRQYGIRGNWLARAVRPEEPAPEVAARTSRPGVNVLGHFRYPSGLQIAGLNMVAGLESAGVAVSPRDVPTGIPTDLVGREEYLGLHPFGVTISQLAPEPLAEDCYPRAGLAMRPDDYRIGCWYWEVEEVPVRWRHHARWLHELWAPTRFIGEALRRALPLQVVDMLAGMRMPPEVHLPRSRFGLPDDRFLFLFVFDMCSTAQRKNPLAVVEAFRRAFAPHEPVALAIKVSRGYHDPASLRELQEACDRAGAYLIDTLLAHDEVCGLLGACDAYVSLHRSEGFGLTMAEAMALGKPVIATGYSGNLDFMTPENSLLVEFDRVKLEETVHVYERGWTWAEPSVMHAAELMRRVVAHPDEARALGERARRDVRSVLSLEAAGRRMAARVAELMADTARRAA